MFIGSNGAGKSNVLEAIGVASASVGRGVEDPDLLRKGVRVTPPPLMVSAFAHDNAKFHSFDLSVRMSGDVAYTVALQSAKGSVLSIMSELCEKGSQEVFHRADQSGSSQNPTVSFDLLPAQQGIWATFRSISPDFPEVRDALDTLAQYSIYAPQVDFLRGQAVAELTTTSLGLHGEGLPATVESLLDSCETDTPERALQVDALQLVWLPGWAEQVRVGRIDDSLISRAVRGKGEDIPMLYFEDQYMEEKRKRLSVYDSSEGTLFLLFVAALLVHFDSPRIFALDNVDNGLNPAMTRKMIEKIIEITMVASKKQLNCGPRQVFLTSHNPTALDAFDLFDDNQRVFVVCRNAKGNTELERLMPKKGMTRDDWAAKYSGVNLSQLWIDGVIPGALGPDC